MAKVPVHKNGKIVDYAIFSDEFGHLFEKYEWIFDDDDCLAIKIPDINGNYRIVKMDLLVMLLAELINRGADIREIDGMIFRDEHNLEFYEKDRENADEHGFSNNCIN